MRLWISSAVVGISMLMTGCGESSSTTQVSTGGVTESTGSATVAAPAPAAVDSVELASAPAAAPAPADQGSGTMASLASAGGLIAITPENSKIGFVGSKDEGTHDGGFTDFAGSIDFAAGRNATKAVGLFSS